MRNTFTFGGILSSDYGVYISGTGVFNAPERDVTTVEIPGRDGVLTLDNGRFREIAHTYPAFVVPPFKDNIRGLRNALLSKRGLVRLSDTYHSDEYYLAYYEKGLEAEPTVTLKEGELEIEFTRDPRRFLLSGETPVELGAWGQTETDTGDTVTIDNDGTEAVKALSVAITPKQAGSGDPSPTNVRAISGWTGATVKRSGKNLIDSSIIHQQTSTTVVFGDTNTANYSYFLKAGTYTFSCAFLNSATGQGYMRKSTDTGNTRLWQTGNKATFTLAADARCSFWIYNSSGISASNVTNPQVELGSSATDFEPYSGSTYSITFPTEAGTIYGGTLDVTTGALTVDRVAVDMGSLTWYRTTSYSNPLFYTTITGKAASYQNAACSMFRDIGNSTIIAAQGFANQSADGDFASSNGNAQIYVRCDAKTDAESFQTYVSGQTLVYPLSEPQTYTLTPEQVELLTGVNNIWSDAGAVTVEHGQNPNVLVNPTLFSARPLIRVYGYGTVTVGDTVVTVAQNPYTYVDIDSEMMDCYHEDDNANGYVSFSTGDFPTLPAGTTALSYTGSITKVEITPRWWRL